MTDPIWTPDPARVRGSNLYAFHESLREKYGGPDFPNSGDSPGADSPGKLGDYAALHRWSVTHRNAFWEEAWRDAGVEVSAPHGAVLTDDAMPPMSPMRQMSALRTAPNEVWFPGARFNFAAHLLRYRDERPALIAAGEDAGEDGSRRTVSYRELYALVSRCAEALKRAGVGPGDRVAGFLPNAVETVVAMLGATALGAIWSSTSPDFGFQGVLDRFGQIDPKILFCADGYRYGGKAHDSLERGGQILAAIPSIEKLVVAPFLGEGYGGKLPPGSVSGSVAWEDFLGAENAPEPEFPQFPFDHPVYILYSSGTTGVPKCIVHGAGGTILKHHTEQRFHTDLGRDDVLFYFTTCGWMMWNWLVSGLAQGCALVLYDGSPAHPGAERLFRLAQSTGITVFGTSPKFLASCAKAGLVPREDFPLETLRTILSTGAPLEPGQFHYVHEAIKSDVQLASIAGGTDLIGCFMLGNPYAPVYAGEIQGPALGMDIAAFDERGRPLRGEQGELVCRQPFPSMPVSFWKDPDGAKYRQAYFEHFPGVWRHGDFVTLTPAGGVTMQGRSDATLNPGGVRIGTAEIYRIVEDLPFVLDSIVVGYRTPEEPAEDKVALFVVLREGESLGEGQEGEIRTAIRTAIRATATARHVPAAIRQISEVPVTINGKKVELAVAATLRGETVKNLDSLANPGSLEQFRGLEM